MYMCHPFHIKSISEDADVFSFHAMFASSVFFFIKKDLGDSWQTNSAARIAYTIRMFWREFFRTVLEEVFCGFLDAAVWLPVMFLEFCWKWKKNNKKAA